MSRVTGRSLDVVEIDGEMVRDLRTSPRNGMSQEALARSVGVSGALIGHVETGYTRRVSRQIAESIARELGISVGVLIRSGEAQDDRIDTSLERISALLERLVGPDGRSPAVHDPDREVDESWSDLAIWATDFMRRNSRRARPEGAVPAPEEVARLATHQRVSVGFDLTSLPARLETTTSAELFQGCTEVAQMIVDALKKATADPPKGANRTILLTYQGHDVFAVVEPQIRADLLQTLREALDRGWNVLHLLRYSSLTRRYLDITSQAVELAGRKGRYVAKYLADDPDSSTDFDLLVIPGSCAIQLWSTEAGQPADAALKLDDPAIQRQMAAVFAKSESAAAQLIDTYPQYTALLRILLYPDQVPGDRYQIKPGPALATVPKDLWRWAAGQAREPIDEGPESRPALDLVDQYERAMIKRGQLLENGLQSYLSYDLMSTSALDDLVHGRYDRNDWLIARAQELQPDGRVPARFRIEHLERLIELLDGYDRFYLGIADPARMEEPFPQNLLTIRMGMPMNGYRAVFVQVWPESREVNREEGFFAVLRETRIVDAFHAYFTELWEGPGVIRDRASVREILRTKIREVQRLESRAVSPRARGRTKPPKNDAY